MANSVVLCFAGILAVHWGATELRGGESAERSHQVQALLEERCVRCHGPRRERGDLRVDQLPRLLRGGSTGAPAVVPGQPEQSLLLRAVRGDSPEFVMPPSGPRLEPDEIELLRRWILEDVGGRESPETSADPTRDAAQRHFAYQPIKRPSLPSARDRGWSRGEIDAFVLARLEAAGLEPAPEAPPRELLRRVCLDLTGLPPDPVLLEEFLGDPGPEAYERAVDRLLGSREYAEHWTRQWLDLARYADSHGFTIDGARSIWPYRDWVLRAIDADLPFDTFTIWQLAGDLLEGPTLDQLLATGFHRNTMVNQEGGADDEEFRIYAAMDRVATTATVWLGTTLSCAQCHGHKYDPFSQLDYYRFFAFFNQSEDGGIAEAPRIAVPTDREREALLRIEAAQEAVRAVLEERRAALRSRLEPLRAGLRQGLDLGQTMPAAIEALVRLPRAALTQGEEDALLDYLGGRSDEIQQREEELRALDQQRPRPATSLVMRERAEPRATHLLLRGNFLTPGPVVEPGVPAILPPLPSTARAAPNRLDLARWLVAKDNPLTPRVTVNRWWQAFFGRGLVETENDFGTRGSPPTHPELLDWLASELIESGFSRKHLHRLIVRSATYRQSSEVRGRRSEADPRNLLLARQNRIRCSAEVLRDSALAAAGLLERRWGGPPVYPPQPEDVFHFTQTAKVWPTSTGSDRYRRSLYVWRWRSSLYPFLATFDAPDGTVACTRRNRSDTPLQALTLANDPMMVEIAVAFARRLREEPAASDAERIERAFEQCLSRPPTERERERLQRFFQAEQEAFRDDPDAARELLGESAPGDVETRARQAALTSVSRVLFNLDEFVTRG